MGQRSVEVISERLLLVANDDASMIQPEENFVKLVVENDTGLVLGC